MTSEILLDVIKKTVAVCRKLRIKVAFMGGIASSVYGRPRATYDVDGMVMVGEKRMNEFLAALSKAGFKFDKRKPIKSISGMPFLTLIYPKFKTYVDLFLAVSPFQKEILRRKRKIKLGSTQISLVSAEDLILLKFLSGRERDLEDAREILVENKERINVGYLEKWAKRLEIDVYLKDELESLGWE